jgi:hypothetical protein
VGHKYRAFTGECADTFVKAGAFLLPRPLGFTSAPLERAVVSACQPAADEPADRRGSRERGEQPAEVSQENAASSTRITGIASKGCRGATDWV